MSYGASKRTKPEDEVTVHELREELDTEASKKQYRYLRFMCQETLDHVNFVNERVKDIEGFWLSTMLKHHQLSEYITAKTDKDALKYLTKIELVQDPKDPRPFSLKFHFKENPYFSDSVLEKDYKLPEGVDAAPADGSITQNMRDFDSDPDRTLTSAAVKINWKSEDKNLCTRHSRANVGEDGEFDGDIGSFFHYFTEGEDMLGVGAVLQGEVLPDAVDYFAGRGESDGPDFDSDDDEEDELDEEDDDDEGSIDLEDEEEQPSKKKSKTG